MDIETKTESLEEAIFKTLSNQKRRDILRFVGENKQVTFTTIKKATQIDDSSSLSYHLNSLEPLLTQNKEQYSLSDLGRDAYRLIIKTNAYATTNIVVKYIRKQLSALIIVNAVLWAVAIVAISEFEGAVSQITASTFALLWLTGNILMYLILKNTDQNQKCKAKRTSFL